MEYPVRINKYLALKNIASRREADELVRAGKVLLNGQKAVLGDKVISEADELIIKKNSLKETVYYAFNKPVGVVTHSPQRNEKSIMEVADFSEKIWPVGRLDKDSWGLIILSNDGRITEKLLSPKNAHEKEYMVIIDKPLTESFLRKMRIGVKIDDGYRTKQAKVQKVNNFLFTIILTEGKNRQIRRMCAALGFVVLDLKRVRILNIRLGKLRLGEARKIIGQEKDNFLAELKLA